MPWTLRNLSCLLSLFCFVFGCFAVPPQLVDQKMWFVNQSILGVDIEVAVYQMEFDQDLYLSGESFLCAEAEDSCPPSDCTPCDWSSQEVKNNFVFLLFSFSVSFIPFFFFFFSIFSNFFQKTANRM